MPAAVALRAAVDGTLAAGLDDGLGRPAMVVRSVSDRRAGALGVGRRRHDRRSPPAAPGMSGIPLVLVLASSGADVHEGIDSLVGLGRGGQGGRGLLRGHPGDRRPDRARRVRPGAAAGPGRPRVMTSDAYAYVSGPRMVRQMTGNVISTAGLGGAGTHQRSTGVAARVVATVAEVDDALADLLAYLPDSVDDEPPRWPCDDPVDRPTPEAGDLLPAVADRQLRRAGRHPRRSSTTATSTSCGSTTPPTWSPASPRSTAAPSASSPTSPSSWPGRSTSRARTRAPASCRSATPSTCRWSPSSTRRGFYPGKDMEWRGMIRHGAQLAFAYARATVPRVGLTLRKSYGGAFIVMDSKTMGCDLHLAWPTAEIAVMGAGGAVGILHRRRRRRRAGRRWSPPTRTSTSTPGSPPSGATSTPSSTPPTPAGSWPPPWRSCRPSGSTSPPAATTTCRSSHPEGPRAGRGSRRRASRARRPRGGG